MTFPLVMTSDSSNIEMVKGPIFLIEGDGSFGSKL